MRFAAVRSVLFLLLLLPFLAMAPVGYAAEDKGVKKEQNKTDEEKNTHNETCYVVAMPAQAVVVWCQTDLWQADYHILLYPVLHMQQQDVCSAANIPAVYRSLMKCCITPQAP